MPLYDFEQGARLQNPNELEQNKYIVALKRNLKPEMFKYLVAAIDARLATLTPSKASQLTWTRLASLLGHGAENVEVADNLWQIIESKTGGDAEACNMTMGSLVKWIISQRAETWLCNKNDTGKQNQEGEEITWTAYWIDETFIPAPERPLNLQGLQKSWGARIR